MIFDGVLSKEEQARAERTLSKLLTHDISRWALTGGFATEIHLRQAGTEPTLRSLNDLDFIVCSFDSIPESIGRDFLIRHVHPSDPPEKTLLQCVDPETEVRIDVFRTYPSVMHRVSPLNPQLRIISSQDLAARAGRLTWDLNRESVDPKYVRDFLRLLRIVRIQDVELVWQQHRNGQSPETFAYAANEVHNLIESRAQFLVGSIYSSDVDAVCSRCRSLEAFPLTDARLLLSILGYC